MIINGDCLEEMKKMEDNSISCIVTDPPYGLSFMSKEWDHEVPGTEYWKETLRITKPGGYLLAMGGTRTFHRLSCAIEDAGYEIRDTLAWIYGSGFPKSHNHFGIEGYGTALKPAYEPIIMAMKPLDGTFKQNAQKWGQAGINIDGCRIESESRKICNYKSNGSQGCISRGNEGNHSGEAYKEKIETKGRWPANVLFDEEAAKMLDEQSGVSKSSSANRGLLKDIRKNNYNSGDDKRIENSDSIRGHSDSGGASRFFYCAKASRSERNEGLEGFPDQSPIYSRDARNGEGLRVSDSKLPRKNNHPTVKPIKLMEYLIKLVMPPKDGLLLDPFAGSGTTILAAHRLGLKAIGIEKSREYCEIAESRLKAI